MAGLIPAEIIAEIRARADIAEIVGENVKLARSGASLKGLCPFHNERTPSFYVHPAKQFYKCFGCGEQGDVFTFVERTTGASFSEAARQLAMRVGVQIPERPRTPGERQDDARRSLLLEVNETAAAFFEAPLAVPSGALGEAGRAYLAKRAIGDAARGAFRLGWAPESWDALTRHLAERGVAATVAEEAGVVRRRRERGSDRTVPLRPDGLVSPDTHFDFFRGRLMFPVITPAREVVAFSGRIVGGKPDDPKYINSPESMVYKKGRLLFGLHAARAEIRKKGRALLVEGNVDVVTLHQAGLGEAVAPLGTALTAEQVDLLRRMTRSVVLATDGDAAGRRAALKDIPLLAAAELDVRLLALPEGEDPDSWTRKLGGEAVAARVGSAQDAIAFLLAEVSAKAGGREAPAGARLDALRELAPLFEAMTADRRAIYVGQAALALGLDRVMVDRNLRQAASRPPAGKAGLGAAVPGRSTPASMAGVPGGARPNGAPAEARPPDGRNGARRHFRKEIELLSFLIEQPSLCEAAIEAGADQALASADPQAGPTLADLLHRIASAAREGRPIDVPSLLASAPEEGGLREELAKSCVSGQYQQLDELARARAMTEMIRNLARDRLRRELDETQRALREAERSQDLEKAQKLLERIVELSRRGNSVPDNHQERRSGFNEPGHRAP